ncbi:MAG TPA: GNAT family N-acetyltransferase [Candidatus Limnocylindrales bacterium]|nr:GNAT family N-acetyltransferase [Candidatus Limnocylindrales bacterium]
MRRSVTTWSLELRSPHELRPGRPAPGLEVRQARLPSPELSRFLYVTVGGPWYWIDRLPWSRGRWLAHLDRPELETWLGWVEGTPVGWFELERKADGDVEIAMFGLLPAFIGRGLGGALLTEAVRRAWAMPGTRRVWVHTCSLDGPAARRNYEARGFRLLREETAEVELPDEPPGSWPTS